MGGPLWKDRLFLFADYHGSRQNHSEFRPFHQHRADAKTCVTAISENCSDRVRTSVPSLYTGTGSYSPTGCASFTTVHGIVLTPTSGNNNPTAALNASVDNGAIFNPLTCAQFGTIAAPNVIPSAQLNAVAMKYLNYFPKPNRTPINNVINNYQNQQVSTTTGQ